MIIIGFVTLAVISVLALAYFYSDSIKDKIRLTHIERFTSQLINSAESVFFSGEPSEATIRLYLPEGVKSIEINSTYVIITARTTSGENKRAFKSSVPLQGVISPGEGIKKLLIQAKDDYVLIS
mgnify:CR=1 FL=1